MKTMILIITLSLTYGIFNQTWARQPDSSELGMYYKGATATRILFWHMGKLTYKIKNESQDNQVVVAPLSNFIGELLDDQSNLDMSPNTKTIIAQDRLCQYIEYASKDVKSLDLYCRVQILQKSNLGTDFIRYSVAYKVNIGETHHVLTAIKDFAIDNRSIYITVEKQQPDKSFGPVSVLYDASENESLR